MGKFSILGNKTLAADGLLVFIAIIWGTAFVAQKASVESVGSLTFNAIRMMLGAIVLVPVLIFQRTQKRKHQRQERVPALRLLVFGTICGVLLFLGVTFQQIGIQYTSVANSSFITSLYVILIPLFGILFGRRTGYATWVAALIALVALFLITGVTDLSNFNRGDIYTLICAAFTALHVLFVDYAVKKIDAIQLSIVQASITSIISFAAAGFNEIYQVKKSPTPEIFNPNFTWQNIIDCAYPLFFAGVLSVGIGYTLQIVAQKSAPPAHVAIIFSSEAMFATLTAILVLHEYPAVQSYFGFALMLIAMLATEFDVLRKKRKHAP
ncbi:MAG: DMT family transporter [Bifidobacteriaceae bacterium]|nr:DMT family transporter [Bifidobacteriaceae bacterium]